MQRGAPFTAAHFTPCTVELFLHAGAAVAAADAAAAAARRRRRPRRRRRCRRRRRRRAPPSPCAPRPTQRPLRHCRRPPQQLAHTSPLEGEDTSFMVTPVLDGLAREAVSFRRAHVQIAVCAPSRSMVFLAGGQTPLASSASSRRRAPACAPTASRCRSSSGALTARRVPASCNTRPSGHRRGRVRCSRGFTEPFVRIPLLERKGVRENGQQMHHSHATPPVRAVPAEEEADLQDVGIVNGAIRQLRVLQSDRAGRLGFSRWADSAAFALLGTSAAPRRVPARPRRPRESSLPLVATLGTRIKPAERS